jgi:hypothetical protein
MVLSNIFYRKLQILLKLYYIYLVFDISVDLILWFNLNLYIVVVVFVCCILLTYNKFKLEKDHNEQY